MSGRFADDFGALGGRIWLNCAHQGPLPGIAVRKAHEAIRWKTEPFHLTADRFQDVTERLRGVLCRLINADDDEVILANSASYGLHLLANGIDWKVGDEILVVEGDFPSDILPWLGITQNRVRVRRIKPARPLPTAEELRAAISSQTRLFCTTWVHSLSGFSADLIDLGRICREHEIAFVVNGSQALGARPLDVKKTPIDAFTCAGFKWLCGPYGTGFCWMRRNLLKSLVYNKTYWLSQMTADDLGKPDLQVELPQTPTTSRKYDVFGTANFFNFVPWTASLEYLLEQGVDQIAAHDQGLVDRLVAGLDLSRYRVSSPTTGPERSTLVYISHQAPALNGEIFEKLKAAGVDVARRAGQLRISPHLYNTTANIDRALEVLNDI